MKNKMKYFMYVMIGLALTIIAFNFMIGVKLNDTCDNQFRLANLAAYYEKLLQDKGVTDKVLQQEIQSDSKRIFNVFNEDADKKSHTKQIKQKESLEEYAKPKAHERKHTTKRISRAKTNTNNIKNTKVEKGLLVDWWHDICIGRTASEAIWHPLFPRIPQNTTRSFKSGDDKRIVGSFFRRIYGFLYTNTSEYYDFKLLSRDGAELLILDTKIDSKFPSIVHDFKISSEVLYLKLTRDTMEYQDKKIKLEQMFVTSKYNVWLKANNLYYIEIVQGGKFFSKYQVQWRINNAPYRMIGQENLLFTNHMSAGSTRSRILEKYNITPRFSFNDAEKRRFSFYKHPVLKTIHSKFNCVKEGNKDKQIQYLYQGYAQYTENLLVYPREYLQSMNTPENHTVMNREQAIDIAYHTFDKLNIMHNSSLQIQNIVHVKTNVDKAYSPFRDHHRTFYFVELDLSIEGDDEIYRSSHFVKYTPSGLCFMSDYESNGNVEINLLTPIKNQKVWLMYLLKMLEDLMENTNEKNVNLILIDSNSTDGDYEEILRSSKIKYKYLSLDSKFSKVRSLNYGIKHVSHNNSIAFVLDLHLQLPLNMFDRIRKLTIQGKTAFSPTLFKLACGEHEQYTDLYGSHWLDLGTGMMAMYKSDWIHIGGFNEKLFSNKWGGEDWEVVDRIFKHGLYLIHIRMPRFYHIHHSRWKMWDRN